jgi:hypothetical protein
MTLTPEREASRVPSEKVQRLCTTLRLLQSAERDLGAAERRPVPVAFQGSVANGLDPIPTTLPLLTLSSSVLLRNSTIPQSRAVHRSLQVVLSTLEP